MMRLIGFELNKMLRSKKNIVVFILMIITMIYLYIMLTTLPGKNPVNSYIWENSMIIEGEMDQKYNPTADKDRISFCEQGLNLLKACKDKTTLSDDYLKWHLEYLNKVGAGNGGETKYQKAVDNYLLKNKVAPEDLSTATNGFFLFNTILSRFAGVFLLLFAFIIGDIFNKEYKNGGHKLLLTQPFKRWKFIVAKYLSSLICCVGASVAMFCPLFLYTGFNYGFGAVDYPMQLTNNFMSLSAFLIFRGCNIVPAYQYFICFFVIALLLIPTFCAIATFISCLINKKALSLTMIAILGLDITYICLTKILAPTQWYNIFSYSNIANILNASYSNSTVFSYSPIQLTFLDGVAVPLLYTAVFTGGSIALLKHKQFNN